MNSCLHVFYQNVYLHLSFGVLFVCLFVCICLWLFLIQNPALLLAVLPTASKRTWQQKKDPRAGVGTNIGQPRVNELKGGRPLHWVET